MTRRPPGAGSVTRTTIPDDDIGEWAICELAQRAAWARELGLDPLAADLVALPPA